MGLFTSQYTVRGQNTIWWKYFGLHSKPQRNSLVSQYNQQMCYSVGFENTSFILSIFFKNIFNSVEADKR